MGKQTTESGKKDAELSEKQDQSIELTGEEATSLVQMIGMSMQMGTVSPQMEIAKKLTAEHIESYLDGQKKLSDLQFNELRERKWFYAAIVAALLVFILVLVGLLKEQPDTLDSVLHTLGGLLVGLVGGYGYGKTQSDKT